MILDRASVATAATVGCSPPLSTTRSTVGSPSLVRRSSYYWHIFMSSCCLAILSAYRIIHQSCHRGPTESEQSDEHEDRAGPTGQPLLHDGGAQLVEGAELQTPEAAQLHGGVFIVFIIITSIFICRQKVSMKTRAAFGSMGSMKMDGSGSSDLLLGSSRSRTGRYFQGIYGLFRSTLICSCISVFIMSHYTVLSHCPTLIF